MGKRQSGRGGMDKKALSTRDICSKFITPAIQRARWDIVTQVRQEFGFTKGRIHVRGKLVNLATVAFAGTSVATARSGAATGAATDPEIIVPVAVWPTLPANIRAAIRALVGTV